MAFIFLYYLKITFTNVHLTKFSFDFSKIRDYYVSDIYVNIVTLTVHNFSSL